MLEEEIKQLVCHKCGTNLGLYRRADCFWCGDCLWAEIERLQEEHNGLTGERKIDYGLMWELDGTKHRLIVVKLAGEEKLRAFIGEIREETSEAGGE